MRRTSSIFIVLVTLGVCLFTYNMLSMFTSLRYAWNGVDDDSARKLLSSALVTTSEDAKKLSSRRKRLFHIAVTADGAPYSQWQCRIMYYWYRKKMDLPGSEMGGYTWILHSGKVDNLMDEIPTFVVDLLPGGLDRVKIFNLFYVYDNLYTFADEVAGYIRPHIKSVGHIVLNRPWAFVQWLEKTAIEEEYVLMSEPDHIFLKPLPNFAGEEKPTAYPFFYIEPVEKEKIIRKFYPEENGSVTNIDPVGNSPVIIKKDLLEQIAPTWMNLSMQMKDDPEADDDFGWVQEMYAYAVASALYRVRYSLREDFMMQPPLDEKIGESFILHYTYGCDNTLEGIETYGKFGEWRFDKMAYLLGPPPRNLPLPPPGVPESVVTRDGPGGGGAGGGADRPP